MNEELLPCPFCGAGNTEIRENGKVWSGRGYTPPTSTSVFHYCTPTAGQPSRAIERVGRDRASAIAAWNQRAEVAQTRVDESFEDLMSDWAHGDALDAARWRELLRFVGGHYSPTQGVWFSVTHLKAVPGTDITDGRVEDHFTKAVDAAITDRAAKETP